MLEPRKVIVGAGSTGLACARYFATMNEPFRIVDDSLNPPLLNKIKSELPDVNIETDANWEVDPRLEDQLVLSPGVPRTNSNVVRAVKKGLRIVGDISIFRSAAKAPIVAITGSNGKSTVTTLVGEIAAENGLNVAVGGNLGVPALDLLSDDVQLYVLELSSFQLEHVSGLNAQIASVLNISEDHLDRYRNFDEYCRTKLRVYGGCNQLIINRQDTRTHPPLNADAHIVSFGLDVPTSSDDFGLQPSGEGWLLLKGGQEIMHSRELVLEGVHNYQNILASLAITDALGISIELAANVARKFRGLPYRSQCIFSSDGLQVINDSKATNVGATNAAIKGLGNEHRKNILWIAGGVGKDADFSALVPAVEKHVKCAILYGKDSPQIARAIDSRTKICNAIDLDQCARLALEFAESEDVILFSPACASFDMFDGYMARGAAFSGVIEKYHQYLKEVHHA